jgi:hypothetical protein
MRLWLVSFSMLLVAFLLTGAPVASGLVGPGDVPEVDPSAVTLDGLTADGTPTEEERLPLIDIRDIPGIWPDDVVPSYPAPREPSTPQDGIADAKLAPLDGAA